ncbi:immunity 49 family protein [Streptomyces sp. NPDC058001]|uniref:immunity 49 family protein n=1 Tax=Streptomyces sp. NPDC058001 TaxID=3346300 RepID=UPI0036E6BFA9
MLTAAQAAHLRALVAPYYTQDDGNLSLSNLADRCRHLSADRWPDAVASHFASLRSVGRAGEGAGELLDGVHARLLPSEAMTPELVGAMRYAREVAEGLVFAYALDGPTAVRIVTDADVARAGAEKLGEAAYTNLMLVPVQHEDVRIEGRATLHSVYGDSPFIASNALFLSELARRVTGVPLPDAGALVVVPTRHLLAFHPIADGSVVDAVNDLAAYALGAYEDGPGALSPRVYWWHQGGLTSLSRFDPSTRTFSIQPPSELLGLMKGLVRLAGAGRITSRAAGKTADVSDLTRTTAESISHLAKDPAGLGAAFTSAVELAHTHCVDDPHVARVDAWDAWATAVQLGSALFTGAEPQEYHLGESFVQQLPAVAANPPADARAWLDAFYLAVVCRQQVRLDQLCQVPLEVLRQDDSVDTYVLHWIDTLQTHWLQRPGIVEKLITTMETSDRGAVNQAPRDFVDLIDYQPIALFHRVVTRDHDAFSVALDEALGHHARFWGDSTAPRARVALGVLAMASLAFDYGFPFSVEQPYLPRYLLNRQRIEVIPG